MKRSKGVRRVVLGVGQMSLLSIDNTGSKDALIGVWTGKVGDPDNPRRRKTLTKARAIYHKRIRLIAEILPPRKGE